MNIYFDAKAQAFAMSIFTELEKESKGRGSLFFKELKKMFDENGYFRLKKDDILLALTKFQKYAGKNLFER